MIASVKKQGMNLFKKGAKAAPVLWIWPKAEPFRPSLGLYSE